jgi:hypothetical protein
MGISSVNAGEWAFRDVGALWVPPGGYRQPYSARVPKAIESRRTVDGEGVIHAALVDECEW